MPPRRIFFSKECDADAAALGGYQRIDPSLEAAWDGLFRNPYEFSRVECDWFSARYVVTKPIKDLPPLCWWFVIADGDVTLVHVEEYEGY